MAPLLAIARVPVTGWTGPTVASVAGPLRAPSEPLAPARNGAHVRASTPAFVGLHSPRTHAIRDALTVPVSSWERFLDGFLAVATRVAVFGFFVDVYDPRQNNAKELSNFAGRGVDLLFLGGPELKRLIAPPVPRAVAEQRLLTLLARLAPEDTSVERLRAAARLAYSEMLTPCYTLRAGQLQWLHQLVNAHGTEAFGSSLSRLAIEHDTLGELPAIAAPTEVSRAVAEALRAAAANPPRFEALLALRVPQIAGLPPAERRQAVNALIAASHNARDFSDTFHSLTLPGCTPCLP